MKSRTLPYLQHVHRPRRIGAGALPLAHQPHQVDAATGTSSRTSLRRRRRFGSEKKGDESVELLVALIIKKTSYKTVCRAEHYPTKPTNPIRGLLLRFYGKTSLFLRGTLSTLNVLILRRVLHLHKLFSDCNVFHRSMMNEINYHPPRPSSVGSPSRLP